MRISSSHFTSKDTSNHFYFIKFDLYVQDIYINLFTALYSSTQLTFCYFSFILMEIQILNKTEVKKMLIVKNWNQKRAFCNHFEVAEKERDKSQSPTV